MDRNTTIVLVVFFLVFGSAAVEYVRRRWPSKPILRPVYVMSAEEAKPMHAINFALDGALNDTEAALFLRDWREGTLIEWPAYRHFVEAHK